MTQQQLDKINGDNLEKATLAYFANKTDANITAMQKAHDKCYEKVATETPLEQLNRFIQAGAEYATALDAVCDTFRMDWRDLEAEYDAQ